VSLFFTKWPSSSTTRSHLTCDFIKQSTARRCAGADFHSTFWPTGS
jgi:hypothetical protein